MADGRFGIAQIRSRHLSQDIASGGTHPIERTLPGLHPGMLREIGASRCQFQQSGDIQPLFTIDKITRICHADEFYLKIIMRAQEIMLRCQQFCKALAYRTKANERETQLFHKTPYIHDNLRRSRTRLTGPSSSMPSRREART